MESAPTLLLNEKQIHQRITRIAWQIAEDNIGEKELVIAGILQNGYPIAEQLAKVLRSIADFKITLLSVQLEKHSQVEKEIKLSIPGKDLQGKVIILVDDVLNSGKTLLYALRPFLAADIKKIRVAVLVNRNHPRFPVKADFSGLTLATTLQEHVKVEISATGMSAFLS